MDKDNIVDDIIVDDDFIIIDNDFIIIDDDFTLIDDDFSVVDDDFLIYNEDEGLTKEEIDNLNFEEELLKVIKISIFREKYNFGFPNFEKLDIHIGELYFMFINEKE